MIDNGICVTRSGRIFDVRRFDVDRLESTADCDDILNVLRSRRTSIQNKLAMYRTRQPDHDTIKKATDALEWCNRRMLQVQSRHKFLTKDGNQSWSTITLAQRFMEVAKDHIGERTYSMILARARQLNGERDVQISHEA